MNKCKCNDKVDEQPVRVLGLDYDIAFQYAVLGIHFKRKLLSQMDKVKR